MMPLMDTLARSILNTVGQYDMAYTLRNVSRFRVNIFKQKGDLAGVFRSLNETVPDYTKLGLPLTVFNMYKKRRGMILIVGPTGSGKSTTLASFLDIINKNLYKHIITLEEPIEYLHWHSRSIINQREIGTDCDTFANGLRAALREDPDVILVGEMRDLETTEIALQSAETGHLVCSTLHTLGAADTINRVIDMYPERQHNQVRSQLSSILEAVVSQQLMPKADGSGYVVAYEVMFKNKYIQKLIRDNKADDISEYLVTDEAHNEGMMAMDETILSLYKKKIITRETALDYAFDRKALMKII
jgi:twitching motility protein PilT